MDAPIFIVGGPRSGTTLLRNMLNRHPAIAICRETEYFHWVYDRRRTFGDLGEERNRRRAVRAYLATRRVLRMQLDMQALEETLVSEGTSYPELFLSLMRFFARPRQTALRREDAAICPGRAAAVRVVFRRAGDPHPA